MRIVDVNAFYAPAGGGVRTYVERKLQTLPAMGHDVSIIVPGARDGVEERGDRARLIHITSPELPVDRNYRYFAEAPPVHDWLDRLAPDVVEASTPWRTASIVADWPGRAVKSLVMHADPLAAYAYRWLGPVLPRETIDKAFATFWRHLQRMGGAYDHVVVANDSLGDRLIEGGVDHVVTVPMGIDSGLFSPELRDPSMRRSLLARCGLGEDALLALGVGRLSTEKRWPLVIEGVTAAAQTRSIGLAIVGGGRKRGATMAAARGNPHVAILGPTRQREDLAVVMASADLLVHGCEAETFGLVAAEAAASGLPLIVPDEGGAASLLGQGSGVAWRVPDPVSLRNAVVNASDNLAALRAEAAAKAPYVRTLDQHFADLMALYAAVPAPLPLPA